MHTQDKRICPQCGGEKAPSSARCWSCHIKPEPTPQRITDREDGSSLIHLPCGRVAIVDTEDVSRLQGLYLHSYTSFHVTYVMARTGRTNGVRQSFNLHRLIMDPPKGMMVDHINGDGLDNRKCNLRICTAAQNAANRRMHRKSKTGYVGVGQSPNGTYYGVIALRRKGQPRKQFSTRSHKTAEDAARARDRLAREHFGEFAILNFPDEQPD